MGLCVCDVCVLCFIRERVLVAAYSAWETAAKSALIAVSAFINVLGPTRVEEDQGAGCLPPGPVAVGATNNST